MDNIPDGREAMRIINEAAGAARLALQRNANTMRYEGQAIRAVANRVATSVSARPAC